KAYTGTYPELTIFEFQQQLRDFIAPKFAEALALSQIPLVEVAGNLSQLNARIEPLIAPYFEDFGIAITQFTVTSVTLPEEVTGYYDKVTGMNMLGDNMDKFQQFNTAIAISKDGNMAQQGAQQGAAMGILLQEMNDSTGAKAEKPQVEGDLRGKLQQIKGLFEEGLIDEQEYKEKKAALLSQL